MSATNATRVHPSVYSVPASVPASDAPASDAPASESGTLAEAARLFARAVREELDAAAPSAAFLPVVFSRVLDQSWSKVRSAALNAVQGYAAQRLGIVDADFQDTLRHDVAVATSVATSCPPRVESAVAWTAPMADRPMKTLKKDMARLSREMIAKLGGGDSRGPAPKAAGAAADAAAAADDDNDNTTLATFKATMHAQVHDQLVHYKARVDAARANEAHEIAKCVGLGGSTLFRGA